MSFSLVELKVENRVQKMARFRDFFLVVLIILTGVRADAGEKGVFRTTVDKKVSITLPPEESTSTLLFWAESPNTTAILNLFVQFPYQVEVSVNQTHIWHIAYLYQPPSSSSNRSSIVAPSCTKYVTFTNDSIKNITISSDKELHWMFCSNIYACGLQPPSATPSGVPAAGYLFEALVGVSALCVLLIIATVSLVIVVLRKKEDEHHYEKALWPPIVPPPLPEDLNNSLNRSLDANVIKTEGVYNKGRERDSLEDPPKCLPVGHTTWNDVTEDPRASILDYESVNSVYGMAI
ncbi:uncharacterized protein [Macrobrachium rosenbergii]|uniref:uncharacterized protein n=1 Tax=Macrobrachium rosenbergii TaxID=79674 RepID=UPI0034D5AA9C